MDVDVSRQKFSRGHHVDLVEAEAVCGMRCPDQGYQSIAQPSPQHQPLGGGGCWCNVLVLVPSPTTAQHM